MPDTEPKNSNLLPCPDCGKQVSIHAANCPHCGHPFSTQTPKVEIQQKPARKSSCSLDGIGCLLLTAIIVALTYFMCNHQDAAPVLPDPPIGLTFRPSLMWTGYVAQITNTHSNAIQVNFHVVNDKAKQEKTWSFPISHGETKEIGMLEVEWHFDPGEHGEIQVQGYTKKLYYKISDKGEHKTWFAL